MKRILIVEDEEAIVELISNRLDRHLFEIDTAFDGKKALELVKSREYDLVTLDIMLPDVDGYEICKELRLRNRNTLIIMISSLETLEHKELGFRLGIDDFIAKPFSPRELAVKITAMLQRRSELQTATTLFHTGLFHDAVSQRILLEGEVLNLTPSEYLIVATLLDVPQKIFSKDELAQEIYNRGWGDSSHSGIDTHIYQIRKKLASKTEQELIRTVRNRGYTLHDA